MPDVAWYRSLYWRIAFGFVTLLAALLAVQILVFLWMTGRMADVFPSRTPAQFASSIASDVGAVLVSDPGADLRAYLSSAYSSPYRPYAVALADGRTFVSERVPPPQSLDFVARQRLSAERGEPWWGRGRSRFGARGGDTGGPGRRGQDTGVPYGDAETREAPASGRAFRGPGGSGGAMGFGGIEFARVLDDGAVVGMVAVPRGAPPMSLALRALGPTLAAAALVLLVAGTAVAALVIFRPTRLRLRQLQDAAREIGAGTHGVRAPADGGDEVTSLAHAFNDMAEQLEQRNVALEAADRARRQLFADVSHELMTPLAAIRGYVETLQMTDTRIDAAARARYLGIVNDESERLEHVIGDLLELARLEGGGGGLRDEDVQVAQLFDRVRQRHERLLSERCVELVSTIAGVDSVPGDRNRLEQVIQNLVANAIRHTPAGGRVSISAGRDCGDAVIAVTDTGPGIPAEHLERVFDRFYKVDESRTGTEVPSGSGLGLSIVRAIVARHGGIVRASNLPGAGARFEIRIPAERSGPRAIG
jgi:signal transduction histidine kinase